MRKHQAGYAGQSENDPHHGRVAPHDERQKDGDVGETQQVAETPVAREVRGESEAPQRVDDRERSVAEPHSYRADSRQRREYKRADRQEDQPCPSFSPLGEMASQSCSLHRHALPIAL
jgi:hypothetical protein